MWFVHTKTPSSPFLPPNRLLKWAKERLDDVFSLSTPPMCRCSHQADHTTNNILWWCNSQMILDTKMREEDSKAALKCSNLVQPNTIFDIENHHRCFSGRANRNKFQFLPSSKYNPFTQKSTIRSCPTPIDTNPALNTTNKMNYWEAWHTLPTVPSSDSVSMIAKQS